jgi:1-acyl-sn-glycerol-3-phosphate acyltransferase
VAKHAQNLKFDPNRWTLLQRLIRTAIGFLIRVLSKVTVEGLENIPSSGACLAVGNHLHVLDAPLGADIIPRPVVAFVKDKWRRPPISWLITGMVNVIYVDVEALDRRTLQSCIEVLKAGGILAVYPEGTRSQTGGLGRGHPGAAFLAIRTSTPILPMAVFGQERATFYWKRLRRVPIHIRIGPLIQPPSVPPQKKQLQDYTEHIMSTLAQMLPEQYRGIYAEAEEKKGITSTL